MIRFKGQIKGVALRQLEIEPAVLWKVADMPGAQAETPTASATTATVGDAEQKIRKFMSICRASARQKAIQLGGMAPDEADRHANSTCGAVQSAFRTCILLNAGDAERCAVEVNPSAD
jgi:hypothetical protein